MKSTLGALMLGMALSLGMTLSADTPHDQLVKNSQQAIHDWQKVLNTLKKAGIKENDSAYKRAHNALKRNEGRLKSLQSGRSHKVAKAAAGAGILGTLGGLFNQTPTKSPTIKTTAKPSPKPSPKKTAPKKSEKAVKRPAAKKAHSKRPVKRS